MPSRHTRSCRVPRTACPKGAGAVSSRPVNVVRRGPLVAVGDLVEDVVVRPRGPVRTGTDNPATVTRTRGGSAANVAVFAAVLGREARFVGRVGADAGGAGLID